MSSALTLVAKIAPSTPSKADGTATTSANPSGIITENQGDMKSFPSLMKKIALDDKRQINDELLASLLAPNAQATNLSLEKAQTNDATLPPAGMFLPLILSQGTSSDPTSVVGEVKVKVKGELVNATVAGRGVDIAAMTKLGKGTQDSERSPVMLQNPTDGTEVDGAKKVTVGTDVDMSSRVFQFTNLKPTTSVAHDTHVATQTILNSLDKTISYQRGAPLAAAHPITDMASTNINTNSLMLQGGDKIASSMTPAPPISVPLQQSQWGDEVGNRIMWMVRQEVQSASIKLNPPHLGPLEVKVSFANDQVNVSFTSHHAPVREALDASMPRLREMLGDNGLQLGDANVTHRSFSDQNQTNQQASSQQPNDDGNLDVNSLADNSTTLSHDPLYVMSGAVDIYA